MRREVLEETGLQAQPLRVVGAFVSRYGDEGKWTVDVVYLARASAGEVRLSPEQSDARWLTIDAIGHLAFQGERDALEALRRQLSRASDRG